MTILFHSYEGYLLLAGVGVILAGVPYYFMGKLIDRLNKKD